MNKMLVAVFDNENKAHEGLTTLKSLHDNGDISLYASAVINKDANGKVHLKTAQDTEPIGTATGLFTGSLIGLLGGPVGVAIGAATGTLIGLLFDEDHDSVNIEFVEEVSNAMTNGKTAVIAEIDEDWNIPVDTGLEPYNAIVFRRYRYEVVDQQLERESKAIADEFDALEEELKHANEERKAKIKASVTNLKNKAKATNEMLNKKINDIQKELDGKVKAIQDQINDANEKRKAKLQKRLGTLQEEYKVRMAKLKKASGLINEALGPKTEAGKNEAVSV
ncbi:MAG: DUF1269 domain-containing protein [Ignavibacteria bacterium]|nr:DUF1269 domain-containing protein [Ignavibacteria bacterium]